MSPGAVDMNAPPASPSRPPTGSEKPSTEVAAPSVPSTRSLNGPPAGEAPLPARLAERFERARDAIVETELYATVAEYSSAAGARMGRVWEMSKQVSWIVGTSALLLVVPLLYEMDKEISANDAVAAGSASGVAADAGAAGAGSAPADAAAAAPAT